MCSKSNWLVEGPSFVEHEDMFLTADVSQVPIGWLKDSSSKNMESIYLTADVSQHPIGWLKYFAL